MKKMLLFCALVLIVSAQIAQGKPRYTRFGIGGKLGAVSNYNWGSGALGIHMPFVFDLGQYGELQYIPGISFWYAEYDRWRDPDHWGTHTQIGIDVFDVKYLPPFPSTIFIKPFIGLGPAIKVNSWNGDSYYYKDHYYWRRPGTYTNLGFNLFLGIDFPVTNRFVPFIEFRGSTGPMLANFFSFGVTFYP